MLNRPKPKTLVELFSQPGTWTQGTYARNNRDEMVLTSDYIACKFCLMGGVYRLYNADNPMRAVVLTKLRKTAGDDDLVRFNDTPGRTQNDILELCKKAGV